MTLYLQTTTLRNRRDKRQVKLKLASIYIGSYNNYNIIGRSAGGAKGLNPLHVYSVLGIR